MTNDAIPYPPPPTEVPEGYTEYAPSHKSRLRTFVICLFLFLAIYFGLLLGSAGLTVLLILLVKKLSIFSILGAIVSGITFIFLVKALFKGKSSFDRELAIEITEQDHPKLFGFLGKICEEVGADLPHKVLVTPDVNAAMMTRSSLVNLFVPPKKELVIGLGLINSMNLSEFKAAMAHEFGHFTQGSRVDGYAMVCMRLCDDMVNGRDWFDRTIDALKNFGGWGLLLGYTVGGCVLLFRWTIQKVFNTLAFQRFAVAWEQEFHADRVAASAAGSNAIVHCLYRLPFAGEAYGQAHHDLLKAADHKLYTSDIYFHQHASAEYLRKKKKDPYLGKPPELADPYEGQGIQVFDPEKTEDPTEFGDYHPSNFQREENVKEVFVPASEDTRSAWLLFDDPAELRERMTFKMYRRGLEIPKSAKMADPRKVQQFIDDEHAETTYDERYFGAYDDRLISPGNIDKLNDLIQDEPWPDERLATVYEKLYSDVKGKADERRELSDELDKVLNESGGAKNKRLRKIVRALEQELEDFDKWFDSLDRRAYLVFVQMAKRLPDKHDYKELVGRYHFHLALQGIYRTARDERRMAHFYASMAFSQENLHPEDLAETMHVLRTARKALKRILREADDINMPAMKNFVEGASLGRFLLKVEIVREFPETYVKGSHVGKLLDQLDEVQSKSARLHFKSLGGILALQEKIAAEFLRLRKPVPATLASPAATKPDEFIILPDETPPKPPENDEPQLIIED